MEAYVVVNRELSVKNQELRQAVAALRDENISLNRKVFEFHQQLIDLRAKHVKATKIFSSAAQKISNILLPEFFPDSVTQIENNSLAHSNVQNSSAVSKRSLPLRNIKPMRDSNGQNSPRRITELPNSPDSPIISYVQARRRNISPQRTDYLAESPGKSSCQMQGSEDSSNVTLIEESSSQSSPEVEVAGGADNRCALPAIVVMNDGIDESEHDLSGRNQFSLQAIEEERSSQMIESALDQFFHPPSIIHPPCNNGMTLNDDITGISCFEAGISQSNVICSTPYRRKKPQVKIKRLSEEEIANLTKCTATTKINLERNDSQTVDTAIEQSLERGSYSLRKSSPLRLSATGRPKRKAAPTYFKEPSSSIKLRNCNPVSKSVKKK